MFNFEQQKKPFFLPYVNKRIIILNKKPSKQSNTPQHKDSQIRLKFFGDFNNNFGVLTLNQANQQKHKQSYSPGFHNKFLHKVLNKQSLNENTLLFSRINLNKQPPPSNSNINSIYHSEMEKFYRSKKTKLPSKPSKKKSLSPLSSQTSNNEVILNQLLTNTNTSTPIGNRNISSLLTIRKIPKEIFRSTIQYAPRVTFNKKLTKFFNESAYSTSYNTISSNENPYY